jgi:DNA-directed RNA polymerase subunit RPC12/RpoP
MVTRCPQCGNEVPSELGQHAADLVRGTVDCPHCGASVTLREEPDTAGSDDVERATAAPPGRTEGQESFAGSEGFEAVAEELKDKPT